MKKSTHPHVGKKIELEPTPLEKKQMLKERYTEQLVWIILALIVAIWLFGSSIKHEINSLMIFSCAFGALLMLSGVYVSVKYFKALKRLK